VASRLHRRLVMDDSREKRIEALEMKLDHLAKRLDALEETVRQIFAEVRALYEEEDLPRLP
jgi:hypothetical protein